MYRKSWGTLSLVATLLVGGGLTDSAAAATDMEARIRQLERQVEALTRALEQKAPATAPTPAAPAAQTPGPAARTAAPEHYQELEERVDALTEAVEDSAQAAQVWDRLHIGGYGELHYNNLDAKDHDNDKKEIDLHRFVLYFGWDFTDYLRFHSEVEYEHNTTGDGNPGEVEIEQAYVQYDINEASDVLGGVFLLPVGILNETHEPTTFYGVERNDVENIILPTTWWAGGAQYGLRFWDGFHWTFAVHEGLKMETTGSNAFRVRSGRQNTAEAVAKQLAGTTSLRYTGIPGLELGTALQYQSDPSQKSNDGIDDGWLASGHLIYNWRMFTVKGLYAKWFFDGDAIKAAGADRQKGWYIEPSVKPFNRDFLPMLADKVGFYFRYEDISGTARARDRFNQWETGFNFWPHPDVVLKFDYRDRHHDRGIERGRDFTGFDLGLGYQF